MTFRVQGKIKPIEASSAEPSCLNKLQRAMITSFRLGSVSRQHQSLINADLGELIENAGEGLLILDAAGYNVWRRFQAALRHATSDLHDAIDALSRNEGDENFRPGGQIAIYDFSKRAFGAGDFNGRTGAELQTRRGLG